MCTAVLIHTQVNLHHKTNLKKLQLELLAGDDGMACYAIPDIAYALLTLVISITIVHSVNYVITNTNHYGILADKQYFQPIPLHSF